MTRLFTFEEQFDRNQIASIIRQMPSPRDSSWAEYIQHRLRMMENGIETYTTRNYARLRFDKHMEWHRAIDKLAGALVNHKQAVVYLGAGTVAANSPISIRKHVRCPGNRKLKTAFEKRGCPVFMVNEYMTSQHCAKCFTRYDRRTKAYRFKTCHNCQPNDIVWLPTMIVTNVSKRALQMKRSIMKEWKIMAKYGNAIAAMLTEPQTKRLVSQKQRFLKNWQPNANVHGEEGGGDTTQSQRPHKTVWHRDICAAKLILYRGEFNWN